jgi:hypothetical protein
MNQKIFFTLFQHVFDRLSTAFRFFRQIFGFLCFRLKNSSITYRDCLPFPKPNPKGILSQCRYTDTKRCASLKPSAPKNKPFPTLLLLPLPAKGWGEGCVLSPPAAEVWAYTI